MLGKNCKQFSFGGAPDQRSVRDRFTKLEKEFKRKRAIEERASGICPDEPDELDQALENIIEMAESQQEQLKRGEVKKRDLEKEKQTAEEIRKRAMERMGETKEREHGEREAKRQRSGAGAGAVAVEYLKERREHESKVKEEEVELRRREFEMKERLQEEEIRMRKKEQEMRERELIMREKELEGRLRKDQDIIFILKQQLQQQQAILEEVQRQNKFLLSLYQTSLEKKE